MVVLCKKYIDDYCRQDDLVVVIDKLDASKTKYYYTNSLTESEFGSRALMYYNRWLYVASKTAVAIEGRYDIFRFKFDWHGG